MLRLVLLLPQLPDIPGLSSCSESRRVEVSFMRALCRRSDRRHFETDSGQGFNSPVAATNRNLLKGSVQVDRIEVHSMTTKAVISPGVCGLQTSVITRAQASLCSVAIDSPCALVQGLAEELTEVDPLSEVIVEGAPPRIWQLAAKHHLHAACPVPVGILKAIEVETGLALPADASIAISRV